MKESFVTQASTSELLSTFRCELRSNPTCLSKCTIHASFFCFRSSTCSSSRYSCTYTEAMYALDTSWSNTQHAFNTAFRESNNGQLGVQSSIFAYVVVITLILLFVDTAYTRQLLAKVFSCKFAARSPKTPVTPAPAPATAQAPTA